MKKYSVEQNSPAWEQLRKTHLTGTMAASVMGTSKTYQEAIYQMVANRLTLGVSSDNEYESPIERGRRLEPEALAAFSFEIGKSIERVGFLEHDDNPELGQSPDAYVADSNYTEAIEVKCLMSKNHIKAMYTNQIPSDYYWQAISYFVVNPELTKLYFVLYNPDMPDYELHIIETERKDIAEDITKATEKQLAFLGEVNVLLDKLIKI